MSKIEFKRINRESNLYLGSQNYFCAELNEETGSIVAIYKVSGKNGFLGEVTVGSSFEEAEAVCRSYFEDDFFEDKTVEITLLPWNGEVDYGNGSIKEAA